MIILVKEENRIKSLIRREKYQKIRRGFENRIDEIIDLLKKRRGSEENKEEQKRSTRLEQNIRMRNLGNKLKMVRRG